MSEWPLVRLVALKFLVVFAFGMCYVVGGRSQRWRHGKVWRRYVGALLLSLGTFFVARLGGQPTPIWMLLSVPAFIAALSLGYDATTLLSKLHRRLLYGLGVAGAGLPIALAADSLMLFWFQLPIALWASAWLGVHNPAKSAVDEEALVAVGSAFVVPFYV